MQIGEIVDKIKSAYFALEDRYYNALDRIDTQVPIYPIVDRIDKYVPSCLLLLVILLLLLIIFVLIPVGVFILQVFGLGASAELTVSVFNAAGNPIDGARVEASYGGAVVSAATDSSGIAVLSVPFGVVGVTVSKENFDPAIREVTVSAAEQAEEFTLTSLVPLPTPKKIIFVDSALGRLIDTAISVSFGCQTAGTMPPVPITVTSGEFTITPPMNCGTLVVTASATGFETISKAIVESPTTITLLASGAVDDGQKGTLKITVNDAQTGNIVNGIKVVLYNAQDIKIETRYTEWGEAWFSKILPSVYSVSVEDEANADYGSVTVENITVDPGATTEEVVEITKSVKANLRVTAEDGDTGAGIEGAEITLLTAAGLTSATQTTNAGGIANFAVTDAAEYVLRAYHEDYLIPDFVDVDLSGAAGGEQHNVTIEMELMTEDNSGRVIVSVADEDGDVVENATVALFDSETDFDAGYPVQITDANGNAEFIGVAEGMYYAFAFKDLATGTSPAGEVKAREINRFTVMMEIGTSTVQITATDKDSGALVPGATAEISVVGTDETITVHLVDGTGTAADLKANKRIEVEVSADGYATWHSEAIQLIRDQTITVNAELETPVTTDGTGTDSGTVDTYWFGNIAPMEYQGMYSKRTGSMVTGDELTAGETYYAKFKVRVPAGDFKRFGMHVRTGLDSVADFQDDQLYIDDTEEPSSASRVGGKTYNPPDGQNTDEDGQNLTSGNAKWTNIWWDDADIDDSGNGDIYYVKVHVKVRSDTADGTELQLHYRTWAVTADDRYLRDPQDMELGEAKDGAAKQGLYAKTEIKRFLEGVSSMCDDDSAFCYGEEVCYTESAIRFCERNENNYDVDVFREYEFNFTITNNSGTDTYSDTKIGIENIDDERTVKINWYEITNATPEIFSGTPLGDTRFGLPWMDTGEFGPYEEMSAKLLIEPITVGGEPEDGKIWTRILSTGSGTEVFSQETRFNVVNPEDIALGIAPAVIPAYTDVDVVVTASYDGGDSDGDPVEEARVWMKQIAPDLSETIHGPETSGSDGSVQFMLNAASPGTKLEFTVQKTGHVCGDEPCAERYVTCGLVRFLDSDGGEVGIGADGTEIGRLESSLDKTDVRDEIINITAERVVEQEVEITSLEILEYPGAAPWMGFDGMLNLTTMKNYADAIAAALQSFTDTVPERDFSIQTKISNEVETCTLGIDCPDLPWGNENSILRATIGGSDFIDTCEFNIPLGISVALAPAPEDTACLHINKPEWHKAVAGTADTHGFWIANGCLTDAGNPVTLGALKARIVPETSVPGSVVLTITPPLTGSPVTQTFSTIDIGMEREKEFFPEVVTAVDTDDVYDATVEFALAAGEDKPEDPVEFTVEIWAEVRTGAGDDDFEEITSDNVDAELFFMDLQSCVLFEIEGSEISKITMEPTENEKELKINTDDCRNTDAIEFRLCGYDGGNCAGGVEGGIELSPSRVEAKEGSPGQVTVGRDIIPGYYGLVVEAKPPGMSAFQEITTVPVIVKPSGIGPDYFTMGRGDSTYRVNLWGPGAEERVMAKNNFFIESVYVGADECSWGESAENFDYDNLGSGIANLAGLGSFAVGVAVTVPTAVALHATVGAGAAAAMGLSVQASMMAHPVGWVIGGIIVFDSICGGCLGIGDLVNDIVCGITGGCEDECDDDCCDYNDLPDFIINLKGGGGVPADYIGVNLALPAAYSGVISAVGNIGTVIGVKRAEDTPLGAGTGVMDAATAFQVRFNNQGAPESKLIYGVLSIEAYENVHGSGADQHLDPSITCSGGWFGPWALGAPSCWPASRNPITSRIHMAFETGAWDQTIPGMAFDSVNCERGALLGITGQDAVDAGALPRMEFSWDWNDIDGDMCDAANPDAKYCDATQFMIMLNKRLYTLYTFLERNDFELACPTPSRSGEIDTYNIAHQTRTVSSGKVGLSTIRPKTQEGGSVAVEVDIINNTSQEQDGGVKIEIEGYSGDYDDSCTRQFNDIDAGAVATVVCSFPVEDGKTYWTGAELAASPAVSPGPADVVGVSAMFMGASGICDMRTTSSESGTPVILGFADDPGTEWTADVQGLDDLEKLVHFQAYLMRDGYSQDFMDDFVDYYNNAAFPGPPTYFSDVGLDTLIGNGALKVIRMWFDADDPDGWRLQSPGLYDVDLAAFFGDNWRFFDSAGNMNVIVIVVLDRISAPDVPSAFYYMPLDGFLGIDATAGTIQRTGYGITFNNANGPIAINDPAVDAPFMTYPDAGSVSPMITVDTKVESGLRAINVDDAKYGTLFEIGYSGIGVGTMAIAPQYATPVMMKVHADAESGDRFSAYYSTTQGNVPVTPGDNFGRWNGAGFDCLDFSGNAAYSVSKIGRKAVDSDIANWQNAYAVDWAEGVSEPGDVYLRTIMYTPADADSGLSIVEPAGMEFITPDGQGSSVAINGIGGMALNAGGMSADYANSLEDIFQMVRDGVVCVTPTTTASKFWWSPKAINDAIGSGMPHVVGSYVGGDCVGQANRSMHCEATELSQSAGNCIGNG